MKRRLPCFLKKVVLLVGLSYAPSIHAHDDVKPALSPSVASKEAQNLDALRKRFDELFARGAFPEAAEVGWELVLADIRVFGLTDLRLASDDLKLAMVYQKLGRLADAETFNEAASRIETDLVIGDHPLVALTLMNKATILEDRGRYVEAKPLLERALRIEEKASDPNHVGVGGVLVALALLDLSLAQYGEGERLASRGLAIEEKALGPDHQTVGFSLTILANLKSAQARYAEAEPLYKRALKIWEKTAGPDHPMVGQILKALGDLYHATGRYADSEPLLERALAVNEKAFGLNHPEVAVVLNDLSAVYLDEDRFADSEILLKRALVIEEKTFGSEHTMVAATLGNLANAYGEQHRYAEAEPLLKRALTIQEKTFGPDHPRVAEVLTNLGTMLVNEAYLGDKARYAEAEPLLKRALTIDSLAFGPFSPALAAPATALANIYDNGQRNDAEAEPLYKLALDVREQAFRPDQREVTDALNNLISFYTRRQRHVDAMPLVRRLLASKSTNVWSAVPAIWNADVANAITPAEASNAALIAVQRQSQSAAGAALNQLAVRFAAGVGRLSDLVRQDQDLGREAAGLDKAYFGEVTKEPEKRNAAVENEIKRQANAVAAQRDEIKRVLAREFSDYAALALPHPLTENQIQALLAEDEALIVIGLDDESYVWVVTHDAVTWGRTSISAKEVASVVASLRAKLDGDDPFEPAAAYGLYKKLLGPSEAAFAGKRRLTFVLNGALTSLPPQLLVMQDPTGKALKDVAWLIRDHAVSLLPSVESLRFLRGNSAVAPAGKPFVGFALTTFDYRTLPSNPQVTAMLGVTRGVRGPIASLDDLRDALSPLPDTATEVSQVAAVFGGSAAQLYVDRQATLKQIETMSLGDYRIVYLATHGLLAGELAKFTRLKAEPALVMWLPEKPTAADDGLLTSSKIAQLNLKADWVVLSACNTAGGDGTPGAEALSGLAKAFFYAGGRSLLVSNWDVDSASTVALMTATFKASAEDPSLSHGEALQKAMLAMIGDPNHPERADPRYWSPFVVVGEPAKKERLKSSRYESPHGP